MPARALLVIALILVLTVAGAVAGLVGLGDGRTEGQAARGPSASPAARPVHPLPAGLTSWLRASVPRDAVVLADPAAARSLRDAGFAAVPPAQAERSRIRFVLATPDLARTAPRYPAAAKALRGSLPVAVVGTDGDGRIAVRQVSAATAADLAADASTRRTAERQLLANPSVRTADAVTDVLRAGDLDLRAATVLALLAASGPVEIVRVGLVPAERAAGRPARTVDIRTTLADLAGRLDSVASEYRVAGNATGPDGTHRLTWPLDVTPVARLR